MSLEACVSRAMAPGNRPHDCPISGASMNPARTLGPGIVGADLTGWWVYVFGDLIGAAIAVVIICLSLPSRACSACAIGEYGQHDLG
jgi:hypothetical protein